MKVFTLQDVLQGRPFETIGSTATVLAAARKMTESGSGSILIVDGHHLKGIVTEHDLLRRVTAAGMDPARTRIAKVMTECPLVAQPYESYRIVIEKMAVADCSHLPVVVDGDRPVGVVSRQELMAIDIREFEDEMERNEPAALFY